jgi:hypothetical protein
MDRREIKLDPMNAVFVRTMEILTWIGLALMAMPGIAYIFGVTGFVGVNLAFQNWCEPVSLFWETIKGAKMSGYAWFIDDPSDVDCLSLIGVLVLALVPLASIVMTAIKADRKYRIILGIVAIEFIVGILRPIIMGGISH